MQHPITNHDIQDAADHVLHVADELNDMINGDRKLLIGPSIIDRLMSAHGVLCGLLEAASDDPGDGPHNAFPDPIT